MLVLTRKCRQSVVVEGCGSAAQNLTVTVIEIRGARVKLGFEVASDVPVDRAEVWARKNGNGGSDTPSAGNGARSAQAWRKRE